MYSKTIRKSLFALGLALGAVLVLGTMTATTQWALAHKVPHDKATLDAFRDVFMEQVRIGDLLFHGDWAIQEELGVTLSKTGMACAMCHPNATDVHPHEFPKYQEQMAEFATLRDMINWCIEKPNQGVKLDPNSDAMKALEAYIYWANRGSPLSPGTH